MELERADVPGTLLEALAPLATELKHRAMLVKLNEVIAVADSVRSEAFTAYVADATQAIAILVGRQLASQNSTRVTVHAGMHVTFADCDIIPTDDRPSGGLVIMLDVGFAGQGLVPHYVLLWLNKEERQWQPVKHRGTPAAEGSIAAFITGEGTTGNPTVAQVYAALSAS